MENNQSVSIQITDNWTPTIFEPQFEHQYHTDTMPSTSTTTMEAPEKKLTLFALRLAILEKLASGIGTLAFIWATVVLLGGYAIALQRKDFWYVTIILLIEGNRIFSRSHELEWQHQATWTLSDAGRYSFRALKSLIDFTQNRSPNPRDHRVGTARSITDANAPSRSWRSNDVPLLPYASWMFLSRNISKLLYWLQILSACACVSLSLMRLSLQDYGEIDGERKNLTSALNIFYGLGFAEAFLFLAEKTYWEWKVKHCRLLDRVNAECHLGPTGMVSVKRFFYDSYSRCVDGSIFDGLKMDLVSFGQELLMSSSPDEQLIGVRILHKFVTSHRFANDTLRKIGTSSFVIERLIEMLNWKNSDEKEIRKSAAIVVSKLAGKKQNALRVAGIPGAMESIASLLFTVERVDYYDFTGFNLLGLLILKKLANDHNNCCKIGNTRRLLAKIIDLTSIDKCKMKCASDSETQTVKRSLQVLKLLANTTGGTGKVLRQEISEIVFTVSNIREILQYAEKHIILQKLGIEILTSLSIDKEARERIGATGGMINELLRLYLREGSGTTELENELRVEAGEALAMLALENVKNCERILKRNQVVEGSVASLTNPVVRIGSFRVLRNLCAFGETSHCVSKLSKVVAATPIVLNAIMKGEGKLLEVALGLATEMLRFLSYGEYVRELGEAGIRQGELVERIVRLLHVHSYPSIKVPGTRRFLVEIAVWLMTNDECYRELFGSLGMEMQLQNVADTMSELECFNVFSGSVGLSRHRRDFSSVIDTALDLVCGV